MASSPRELAVRFETQLKTCRPKPSKIVGVDEEGKEHPISKPPGLGKWKTVAKACVDLLNSGQCERVELRGSDGGLLRALRVDDGEAVADGSNGNGGGDFGGLMKGLPKDLGGGDTSEVLRALAMGLNAGMRVADHAVERLVKIVQPSLTAQTDVIKTLSTRLSTLEAGYGRLLGAQEQALLAQIRAERAVGAGEPMTETDREAMKLLTLLAEKKLGSNGSNGKKNGNGHASKADDEDMPPEPPDDE